MFVLSFRSKLLLAMTIVVAGVSITTLFVTQRRVQANYERNLRKQFHQQISYFVALQEARLENIQEQCRKLSQSVRLIAHLKEQEVEPDLLYETAFDELQLRRNLPGPRVGPGTPRRPPGLLFSFLDAEGRPLEASEKVRRTLGIGASKRRLEQRLNSIRRVLNNPELQQIGYLPFGQGSDATDPTHPAIPRNEGKRRPQYREELDPSALQEVIVTKIVDDEGDGVLAGAMIIAFPLPDLIPKSPSARNAPQPIQSGVLLEERLYADEEVISEQAAITLAPLVTARIRATTAPEADFECDLQGIPYRVFYQLLNEGSAFPPAYQVCLYSLEEAQAEQEDLRWKIIASGAFALAGALILSLLLSHGLAVPIRELATATQEIREGNFQVNVPVRSRDEIGQLAASFNTMALGLALKEKYRAALNMVADEKVAQKLVAGQISLGGELREVTVLFCDIRGFTALTESMPPGEVIDMLNEHMTALTGVVKQHQGLVDKFVGDTIMVLFGAPVSHGNDPLDAVRCALGLVQEREKLNQVSRHKLQVGIGVATGKVVAGGMGSVDRLNYTTIGERVNLASRLCNHAGPGEILIDRTTYERLQTVLIVSPVPALQLKGFSVPTDAFRVCGFKAPDASAPDDSREQKPSSGQLESVELPKP